MIDSGPRSEASKQELHGSLLGVTSVNRRVSAKRRGMQSIVGFEHVGSFASQSDYVHACGCMNHACDCTLAASEYARRQLGEARDVRVITSLVYWVACMDCSCANAHACRAMRDTDGCGRPTSLQATGYA